jgi:uncharacterized membrane protein
MDEPLGRATISFSQTDLLDLENAAKEYLAVATTSANPTLGEFSRSSLSDSSEAVQSILQIWSLDCTDGRQFERVVEEGAGGDALSLEMGICVDVGEAWQLRWCPHGGAKEDSEVRSF